MSTSREAIGWLRRYTLPVASLALLSSCASFVTSKPAHKDAAGIEYALCRPAVVATPLADGRVSFETACLPDPERRYVISGYTLMGNLTLNVERSNDMILTKVTIDPNNSAVAAEAAKAAGAIAEKRIEIRAAAEKERANAQKEAVDAAKTKKESADNDLVTATIAVKTAEDALTQQKRDLETLLSINGLAAGPDPASIISDPQINKDVREAVRKSLLLKEQKEIDLAAAKAKAERAKKAVEEAEKGVSQAASSGNTPNLLVASGNTQGGTPVSKVWGPLVYEVQQTADKDGRLQTVRLVGMFEQPRFEVANVKPPKEEPKSLTVTISAVARIDNTTMVTLKLSEKVQSLLDADRAVLQNAEPGRNLDRIQPTKIGLADDAKDTVTMLFGVPNLPNKFTIIFWVKFNDKEEELRVTR